MVLLRVRHGALTAVAQLHRSMFSAAWLDLHQISMWTWRHGATGSSIRQAFDCTRPSTWVSTQLSVRLKELVEVGRMGDQ
jgi:hypothetical protein